MVLIAAVLGALAATGRLGQREAGLRPPRPDPAHLHRHGLRLRDHARWQAAGLHHPTVRRHRLHLLRSKSRTWAARATHRILDGATAAYGLEWSPDRRNLIFAGTFGGRWGIYLVSALGGPPRYLSSGAAMFWAGGDSLLVGPPVSGGDSVF